MFRSGGEWGKLRFCDRLIHGFYSRRVRLFGSCVSTYAAINQRAARSCARAEQEKCQEIKGSEHHGQVKTGKETRNARRGGDLLSSVLFGSSISGGSRCFVQPARPVLCSVIGASRTCPALMWRRVPACLASSRCRSDVDAGRRVALSCQRCEQSCNRSGRMPCVPRVVALRMMVSMLLGRQEPVVRGAWTCVFVGACAETFLRDRTASA